MLGLSAFVLAITSAALVSGFQAIDYTSPSARVAGVTKSLAEQGRFESADLLAIRNKFAARAKADQIPYWQDAFAVRPNGELFPKHSPLSAILAVPFYILFGQAGFLVFQGLCVIWIGVSLFIISLHIFGYRPYQEIILVGALAIGTQLGISLDSYVFSYDPHGAALILGGTALAFRYPIIGAVMAGFSVLIRPTFMFLLPVVLVTVKSVSRSELLPRLLGLTIAAVLVMAFNLYIFKDPFTFSYHRIVNLMPSGELMIVSHSAGFSWDTLTQDWGSKILFRPHGLVPYNLSLIFLPWVILWAIRQGQGRFVLIAMGTALLYTLYIFAYPGWIYSFRGNRFLYVPVLLYLTLFVPWLADMTNRTQRRCRKAVRVRLP